MQIVDTKRAGTATLQAAGRQLSVRRAPRPRQLGTFGIFKHSVMSLLKGMRLTLSYLLRPSTVVTRQYPENRATLKMHDRYRAQLKFIYEPDGFFRCTSCRICERECPNDSIIIEAEKGKITKKWELERYIWRLDTCTFCNICVMVCPFDAIEWSGNFESSVYDRRLLIYNLNNYAGPDAALAQKVSDPEQQQTLRRPCSAYSGPLPLTGKAMHGIPALEKDPGMPEQRVSVQPEAQVAAGGGSGGEGG